MSDVIEVPKTLYLVSTPVKSGITNQLYEWQKHKFHFLPTLKRLRDPVRQHKVEMGILPPAKLDICKKCTEIIACEDCFQLW
jgi:hypothetical protein